MERKIDILGYLPDIFHTVRDFQQIARTENAECMQLAQWNQQDLADAFILTAQPNSIAIWEKEIGIHADPYTETLEFRRKRLINRYTMKPPFTMIWLEQQLQELLGDGFLGAKRDADLMNLTVYADLMSLPLLREFDNMLEAILPLNMQYDKRLKSHREVNETYWAAMAAPMHLHIAVLMA
jgi:Uncharacterized protein conserved in bacteria (DUF2313).